MMFDLPFDLPDGWEVKTIQQLIHDEVIEKPLDGNHGGIHPKSADYVEEGVPFVMASDLEAGKVNLDSCKFISEKLALTLRKGFSKVGDVLISHKATIGRTAIVQDNKYDFIMLTPQITYYRIKKDQNLNNIYLKAYFDSSYFQTILGLWAGAGSTRAYLGITAQLKLPVVVPPIDKQLSIANHVGAINNKIELNRQTNQTLEQIAQALFKSWFVDFEPVKAKIKAKQNGQNPELAAICAISGKTEQQLKGLDEATLQQLKTTAALFPDALVESELGEIPEGWNVGSIGDIAKAKGGYAFKGNSFVEEGNPVVKIKNITGDGRVDLIGTVCIDDEQARSAERFKLSDGDLLMAMTGATVAKIGFVVTTGKAVYLNQRVAKFESEKFGSKISWFLYCCFQRDSIFETVIGAAQGSAQPNISSTGIESTKFVLPSDGLIEAFCEYADSFFKKWLSNINENSILEENREALLPKLLSGELAP